MATGTSASAAGRAGGSGTDDGGTALRIAHLQHPYVPGLGYQENYLPAAQQALGAQVLTLTSDVVPPKFEDVVTEVSPGVYEYNGVETRRLEALFSVETIEDVALSGVADALDDFEPDVVHAHGLVSPRTLQAMRYARDTDVALFVDVHVDNDNFSLDSPFERAAFGAFRRLVLPRLLDRTAAFLPVNPLSAAFLDDLGVPDDQRRLLPLGVDPSTFAPDPDQRAATRGRLDAEDAFLLVTAGNLEPSKDVGTLIDALARVLSAHPDTRLLVVGGGEDAYIEDLRDRARAAGVAHAVTFTGAVERPELAALYNAADVGVWPGKLGMAIVEAVGTGLPVVVCDSPATAFLTKRDNGLSFPRGDADALADRLIDYGDHPKRRARAAVAGAAYAREELAWSEIAATSLQIYREDVA